MPLVIVVDLAIEHAHLLLRIVVVVEVAILIEHGTSIPVAESSNTTRTIYFIARFILTKLAIFIRIKDLKSPKYPIFISK